MSKEINPKEYDINLKQELSRGTGESDVDMVEFKIGKRKVDFARKKPLEYEGFSTKDNMEHQFKMHKLLQEKGYPVPSTWRYDKSTGETFITDLTEGGMNFIIDLNHILDSDVIKKEKITVNNVRALEKEIRNIAQKATQDGLSIPEDSYFFVVNKETGNTRIVLGDLGTIGLYPDEGDLFNQNFNAALNVVTELKAIISSR